MSKASRRLAGLLAATAIVVSAVIAGPASAAPAPWDPQTSNVPYLAWRGEQVRLVKCNPVLATEGVNVEFFVEEWSGSGLVPRVEEATVNRANGCAQADVVSLDPGLARVKLVATNTAGVPVLKHQFLVIWMSLTDPAIDEVGTSDPTGDRSLGDPAGDGSFKAGGNPGRVQVIVKGTFPYGGTTYTLPDAWPTLANLLAQDADANPANNAAKWDIHDDTLKTENHPLYSACTTHLAAVTIDAVDNCNGAGTGAPDQGPFSRVFGNLISAFGPFDPVVPARTLLSDGKVDSGDAPMPAARVDVSIDPNSGAPTDIGGVGFLQEANKTDVYSRSGVYGGEAHNLYAPFYDAYIPATSRPGLASGIDGPASGNNFTGFLWNGPYDFWQFASVLRSAQPVATTCLRRSDQVPSYRQTPSGAQSVVVYTDEHGEAQVKYNPGGRGGSGFYFDNLPVIHNDNGGCDLEGIDVLGTSRITATARYPYQPVSDPDKVSAPLTKTVHNLFTKTMSYYPKGPGTANSTSRIVVAHAQDIDGAPFAGEKVCFFVDDEADGAFGFTGTTGPADHRFTVGGTDGGTLGTADVCRITDAYGNAAIEVINSDPQSINVTALFVPEALLRDTDVNFATAGSTDGPLPPGAPPVNPSPPITAGQAEAAGVPDATKFTPHKGVAKKARVAVSYMKTKAHKRFVVLRVTSAKGKAKVRIRLIGKHGRTLKVVVRKVRTNHLVSIRVSSKVKKARVALVR